MPRASLFPTIAASMLLAPACASAWAVQEPFEIPAPILPAVPVDPELAFPPASGHEIPGPVMIEEGGPVRRFGLVSRWKDRHRRAKLHIQERVLGFPEEFHEPALGHFVYAHGRTQVANGQAARMILYDYDFVPGTDQLNHRGRQSLAQISAQMPTNFSPLVIEQTPRMPGLDLMRRQSVLASLGGRPFPIPPERVVIGPPPSRGLSGIDSEMIHQNLMIQTMTNGTLGGVGGGAIGGTSGQGFGSQGNAQPSRPQ